MTSFEIFLAVPPGLEPLLLGEAEEAGFSGAAIVPGGVVFQGGWPEVWRANIQLRGATRVLARFAAFRAMHLAQLDKRARKLDWGAVLRPDVPVRVDVTCRSSRIYHDRAARQRLERAITEGMGAEPGDGGIRVMARIEDDLVTLSLDSSGAPLHRRGHKEAVGKAPLRETLAALFLRACGFDGTQTVVDPMCGSGTFVIEAAEIAAGLAPGRSRAFAFERLAACDEQAVAQMRAAAGTGTDLRVYGADRDDGAIRSSQANAMRAGVAERCTFTRAAISDLRRPDGPPGLVMVNPPYGARIGNRKLLFALYGSLGQVLKARFGGWRLGMVTSDGGLAKATGLPLTAGPPVDLGGIKVKLYQAAL